MDEKKKEYNILLSRLLKGMKYLDDLSVPYEVRLRSLDTWILIRCEMEKLLEEIGEKPMNTIGGTLVAYEIGDDK